MAIKLPVFFKRIMCNVPVTSTQVMSDTGNPRMLYNARRHLSKHGAVCQAPSVNMRFAANGTVTACCMNNENILGRYPQQTIGEIWNSAQAQAFRQSMRDYKFLSGCHVCARDYNHGDFEQIGARQFDDLPQHTTYPTMMEFLLSNTCNLECVMCNGELSSSIRANREKLPPLKNPYDEQFVEQLQEFIPHLTETRFSGSGEAFAIKINYTFWEMLIAQNPACRIVVQTNATILNARVKDFLNRGNFTIGVSLDSLDKSRYESIRVNASFNQVMSNIDYMANYSKVNNRPFLIAMCVMRDNVMEMPDFIHYCNRIGAHVCFHKVWAPLHCAVYNLPYNQLQQIYTTLSRYTFKAETSIERYNKAHYAYYLSVIKTWMQEAATQTQNFESVVSLSLAELQDYAKERLRVYINRETMLEENKEELIRVCIGKLDSVLAMWPDDEKKQAMLIRLCLVIETDVLTALKTMTVEKLYEMSVATSAN